MISIERSLSSRDVAHNRRSSMLAPALTETTTYPRPSAANTSAVIRTDLGALEDKLAGGSVKKLSAKEHLFLEGDPKTHVYKVDAGTVLIYKILPDSKRQVIDIAFPGDHIGLGSTGEHAFNAQATEPVRVRCLAVGTLHHLAALDPGLSFKLYQAVAHELDAARNHLLTIGYRDASGRLASFLLALAKRNERHGQDATEFVLPMRRADIGDFLGLTIETVSRTFSKLKAEGLIDLDQGGYVRICDPVALDQIAHGEAGHA
jgi:CRP-like cAMP-binding protein